MESSSKYKEEKFPAFVISFINNRFPCSIPSCHKNAVHGDRVVNIFTTLHAEIYSPKKFTYYKSTLA